MEQVIRWGVLSTARIGVEKVIPAMQKAHGSEIAAIASRESRRAQSAAQELGIPKAYGSYEELLADEFIDAVYIPLPNSMHVAMTEKVLEAGKHVLCEKPFVTETSDLSRIEKLLPQTGLLFGEGFMVLHHPRWIRLKELVASGLIGKLQHIDGFFSFFNPDPENIRNKPELDGGSVYDIGVYPIVTSRFVLGQEPTEVFAGGEFDPGMGIDRLTSVIMRFPDCTATFTCSMQIAKSQHMSFYGTEGVLNVDMPFNAPDDRHLSIYLSTGFEPETRRVVASTPACNQYTLQAESFYRSVTAQEPFIADYDHAVKQGNVLKAVYRSIRSGQWEEVNDSQDSLY
ncbi:MAG: Gfo/Idh/MocA family protein [Spirochaetota bacterium]